MHLVSSLAHPTSPSSRGRGRYKHDSLLLCNMNIILMSIVCAPSVHISRIQSFPSFVYLSLPSFGLRLWTRQPPVSWYRPIFDIIRMCIAYTPLCMPPSIRSEEKRLRGWGIISSLSLDANQLLKSIVCTLLVNACAFCPIIRVSVRLYVPNKMGSGKFVYSQQAALLDFGNTVQRLTIILLLWENWKTNKLSTAKFSSYWIIAANFPSLNRGLYTAMICCRSNKQ